MGWTKPLPETFKMAGERVFAPQPTIWTLIENITFPYERKFSGEGASL
jgi:hypothetical protein